MRFGIQYSLWNLAQSHLPHLFLFTKQSGETSSEGLTKKTLVKIYMQRKPLICREDDTGSCVTIVAPKLDEY